MANKGIEIRNGHIVTSDPPIAELFFSNTRMAWLWLIIRVYVGWQWLGAGLNKFGSPAWTGENAGAAIAGFVRGALEKAGGENPSVQGWYAAFLENFVLPNTAAWAWLITLGEIIVGIALILGFLTGIAAFFGSIMNVNFLLAGTISTNPILFILATWIVLAWKIAGWWGLDRWLLPALGTPWQPGTVFDNKR